jgi:hypothetical protein
VAVGPFERGPVHLALDWHNNAQAPPSCRSGGGEANVLATLWTDDADLASYLRDRFAMPAFEAPFSEDASQAAAARGHTWTWGPDGLRSSLSVLLSDGPTGPKAESLLAFWPAGDGVGRLQLNWTATSSNSERPAQGSMRPPMLAGDFTGLGRWMEDLDGRGGLALYQDPDCAREVAA